MSDNLAHTVVMIRPAHFGFNPETEGSNTLQRRIAELSHGEIEEMALHEFDRFVAALKLTNQQVYRHFAGNMLCLAFTSGQRLLVMSKAANSSLTAAQRKQIEVDFGCRIFSSAMPTIERLGGGSARCMLAEVF